MDKRLMQAAKTGDVEQLLNLIKDDPFVLRATTINGGDTPLHVACMCGHLGFAKEVLVRIPGLSRELNQDGFSPLHIASANGDLEIVKELLKVDQNICLFKGANRRIPLHNAVIKGRTQVMRELLLACVDSVSEVAARGDTTLHLAVKYSQFDAFKVLVEHLKKYNKEEVLNMKDDKGNTILHLAVSKRQYEVVDLLLDENCVSKGMLEVNPLNKNGLTPLNVLLSEGGDIEIEELLRLSGAKTIEEIQTMQMGTLSRVVHTQYHQSGDGMRQEQRRDRPRTPSKRLQDYFKYDKARDSPSKARNTLLVIVVLIATATYQAVLSPPGGVWQDDFTPDHKNNNTGPGIRPHYAGQTIMGTKNTVSYGLFLVFNSVGFFMSLHMLNFLTVGFPLQLELQISLIALTATYDTCMIAITPNGAISLFFTIFSIVLPIVMPTLTKLMRDYRKRPTCSTQSRGICA